MLIDLTGSNQLQRHYRFTLRLTLAFHCSTLDAFLSLVRLMGFAHLQLAFTSMPLLPDSFLTISFPLGQTPAFVGNGGIVLPWVLSKVGYIQTKPASVVGAP